MAFVATHLADTSALSRAVHSVVAGRLSALREAGRLATCSIIDLEVLIGVRSGDEHHQRRQDRAFAYELIPVEQPVLDRALDVQEALAHRGAHRGAPLQDLIIAAAAERAQVTLLHYDSDFDLIASVTGQPCEWVAERGTVD